jgi:hypothetical protein
MAAAQGVGGEGTVDCPCHSQESPKYQSQGNDEIRTIHSRDSKKIRAQQPVFNPSSIEKNQPERI